MDDTAFFWFGGMFGVGIIALMLILLGKQAKSEKLPVIDRQPEIDELYRQCQRLRQELKQQSQQLKTDFQESTFSELKTLLTNYPSACKMAISKPDLPAKNLIALFAPLENLLSSWGYETIGKPWEQVNYDPQLHQPDSDDISVGELVYVRFVGYRDRDKILYPAKVSRTLLQSQL